MKISLAPKRHTYPAALSPSTAAASPAPSAPLDSYSPNCEPCQASERAASSAPPISAEFESVLAELRDFPNREYYNAEKDAAAKDTYYRSLDWSASGAELFSELSQRTQSQHKNVVDYRPSKYLYPWIDLHPDGQLRSLYSGATMLAEEAILQDWSVGLNQRQAENAVAFTQVATSPETAAAAFALQESAQALNCEHVVPQSWFSKSQPARGDLHHLFACESRCNSRRSNLPYDEIQNGRDDWRDDCGKIAGESDGRRFEPVGGKGAAARATLYFLLRYPGVIDRYDDSDLKTLLDWNEQNPVTEWERHRNQAIFEVQGNRNPLIDFPEKARSIDFSSGLK